MPDLTLYKFSELKKEEIKIRLLEDYNTICYRVASKHGPYRTGTAKQRNLKSVYQDFKTYLIPQLKSFFLKMKPIPKR